MTHVLGTVLALALVMAGQPSAKPNFSGEWKLNLAKSNFGAVPPPTSSTRKIAHAEPSLTINEESLGGMGDQSLTRKYVTDGTETTFSSNGAAIASAASWKNDVLEVVSRVEGIGLTFTDLMSLGPDGKTLTSQLHITSPQGDIDITLVFEKQ